MLNVCRINGKNILSLPCISFSELSLTKRFKHDRQAVKQWYQTLGVNEDCEDEALRLAFVYLAKKFHPDSGTQEANAIRFSEIENAYRQISKLRVQQRERDAELETEEFDIKHTAPQHRHYLTYDIGIGTPSKRQKLHTIQRAQQAAENVMEHRLQKLQAEERNTLVGKDKQRAKDIKTRFGMDRLVEDLIQEAMNKGEFSDLKGMGKPLRENLNAQNPYVDFVTHKLNQVLIDNGFTPEWIQLSKEIREETHNLRKDLAKARNQIGHLPLSATEEASWRNIIEPFQTTVKQINNKIDKYNLLVPILQKQMLHVQLNVLANEALTVPPKKVPEKLARNIHSHSASDADNLLLKLLNAIVGGKST